MGALEEIVQTIRVRDIWIDRIKIDMIHFDINHHLYGEITLKNVWNYIKNGRA